MSQANTVIILDFETTGMSPGMGDRVIEVGAVRIDEGEISGRFQALMNPGRQVPPFIEDYTGITNAMLKNAAPCGEVMAELAEFVGDYNLVAHNASFDQRFLDAEWQRIKRKRRGEFACSMLVSRRIFPEAESHKLGTLVRHLRLSGEGDFHRALFDAEMTAKLWLSILARIEKKYRCPEPSFAHMQALGKVSRHKVDKFFAEFD